MRKILIKLTVLISFISVFETAYADPPKITIDDPTGTGKPTSITIQSDRLYMRNIQEGDKDRLHALFSDPVTMEKYMEGGPRSREEIEGRFQKYFGWWQSANPYTSYLIFLRGDAAATYLKEQADLLEKFTMHCKPFSPLPLGAEIHRLRLTLTSLQKEFEKSQELFVGHVLLEPGEDRPDIHTDAEISYILRPPFWERNLGTEGVKNIIALTQELGKRGYTLNGNKVKDLIATARGDNPGSCGVLEKNGFKVASEKEKFGVERRFYTLPVKPAAGAE